MQDKVTRIREILEGVIERKNALAPSPEPDARRAYQAFASNDERAFVVDPAPRAKAVREILRIATTYNWPHEVERALDAAEVMSLACLGDADLDALLSRMRQLEDCARNGFDSPDSPVAR